MSNEISDLKERFETIIGHIHDSLMSMDFEVFEKLTEQCVEVLTKGGKIIVSGIGKNAPVGEKFVDDMLSLSLDARFMDSNIAFHGRMGMINGGDLVIILSKSGETNESLQLNAILKKLKINTWTFTFEQNSTLAKECEQSLILKLEQEDDMWNIMPINSATVSLIVLQELVISIATKMEITLDTLRHNHSGGTIGKMLRDDCTL